MGRKFRKKVEMLLERKNSRIVVALDPSLSSFREQADVSKEREIISNRLNNLLGELEKFVSGAKIGVPTLISLGLDRIKDLIEDWRKNYFFICDTKMADIGYINVLTAKLLFDAGFDGIIMHAAIGASDGLVPVIELAEKEGKGILGLCAMSHAGADEFLNRNVSKLLRIAYSAKVDGFVLPATKPKLIRMARKSFPEVLIFSPGVGAQGAPFGSAISAGSDFEIIGRSITEDQKPAKKAMKILEAIKNVEE